MTFNRENTRDHWPCGDYPDGKCPKRQPGCQDRCPEMLAAQLVRMDEQRAAKKRDAAERAATEYTVNIHARLGRKKIRET